MNDVEKISLILPIYNQADHVESIVQGYSKILTKINIDHEMILVVNGSRDNSLLVCNNLAEKLTTVRVLHSETGGWGRAVKLGLTNAQGDLICYTNSARTLSQDLHVLLLYALAYPSVVIKAHRKIRDNRLRSLGSLLYNLQNRFLFDLPYWDINGTPKVFPRKFDKLLTLTREDDLIDLEFNIICRRENYPLVEVPLLSIQRHSGESTTNYRSAIKMYWGAYQISRIMKQKNR